MKPVVHAPKPPAGGDGDAERAASRANGRIKVLVIDDEPMVGRAICRALRTDCDVVVVQAAEVALDRIAAGDFDVILCDLYMPAMSGEDFYRALSTKRPAVAERIVFLSGATASATSFQFLQSVPNASLEKPFDIEVLRGAVRLACGREASRTPR